MDIFESLENLPVSEECFDEIMGLVESLVTEIKKKYPHPAVIKDEKSADYESAVKTLPHREKLLSKALELRRKANSPFSSKYASKNDNGEEQTRNRSAEVLFLKDKVSESLYEEIIGIVEEYINELNKYEQYKVDKDPKLKKELENRQEALKDIGNIKKQNNNPYAAFRAEDILADENRDALGRNDDIGGKVSFNSPDRRGKRDKSYSGYKRVRTEQSQRGSSKDIWNRMDTLMDKVRKANKI